MPRRCTVCDHPESHGFDEALVSGAPYRSVAKRFEVSESAVYRHKTEHLSAHLPKAKEVEVSVELTGQKVGKADEVVLTDKGQELVEVRRSQLSSSSPLSLGVSDDDEEKTTPKKTSSKPKKPKSAEEEEELRSQLTNRDIQLHLHRGRRPSLPRVGEVGPEMALDIETYERVKRDAVLYTKCSVRLISLHYSGESWFIDCDHVPNELVVSPFRSRCTMSWCWNAPRRKPEESRCGSRRRWARPWRRSWAKSLADRGRQRSAMVRAGVSAWSWRTLKVKQNANG
jgi:hypothetical protein